MDQSEEPLVLLVRRDEFCDVAMPVLARALGEPVPDHKGLHVAFLLVRCAGIWERWERERKYGQK